MGWVDPERTGGIGVTQNADSALIERLSEESDFQTQVVAFALGMHDGNVADAMAWLADLASNRRGCSRCGKPTPDPYEAALFDALWVCRSCFNALAEAEHNEQF